MSYYCDSPDYCTLLDHDIPNPTSCNCCSHLKEKTYEGVHFPEGFDGLRTTIQYALPYMGNGTFYQQANFVAKRVREWQLDTSKIPGTVYRRILKDCNQQRELEQDCCNICKFHRINKDYMGTNRLNKNLIRCHRYPPQWNGGYPLVDKDEYCGEFIKEVK